MSKAPADLRTFVDTLDADGQLLRIAGEVDPVLELAEIAHRQMRLDCPEGPAGAPKTDPVNGRFGGRALLFENVAGSDLPVLINHFGSYARMRMALGCEDLESLAGRIAALLKPDIPAGLVAKLRKLPELAKLGSLGAKLVRTGPVKQVVQTGEQADLTALPVIQCWPGDGAEHPAGAIAGRFVTLGQVVTAEPDTDCQNAGMYRVQLFGPREAGMHIHPHHDGARHWRLWRDRGEPMPAAIVLGGPPALTYASTAPVPPGFDEALLAGFLLDGPVEVVECETVDLHVPAAAEIVIEGLVSTDRTRIEGPFGDHTGYYSLPEQHPVFTVTAITRRRDAIYPATIVGPPPMEDYYLGKATERIFLPMLRTVVPDVLDLDLPMFGAFHNFAFVKIRKQYPLHARKVMHALWGAGQLGLTKCLVVVDEEVDIHDANAVWFAVGAHVDYSRDIEIVRGPVDILDHASAYRGAGGKMGIDATRKIDGEGTVRDWPDPQVMTPEIVRRVSARLGELGLQ